LGNVYYVATNGSDTNSGTSLSSPFASLQKAMNTVSAGDTIYIRGGTYRVSASISVDGKDGTSQNPIKVFAYQGEIPVLDGTNANDGKWALISMRNASYWNFRGIKITNAKGTSNTNNTKRGMQFVGDSSYNLLEDMEFFNNEGTGLHLEDQASYNKIIGSKSHHNYDPVNGGSNSDGFSVKNESTASNNEFLSCQAYYNSDDGWDLWNGGPTQIRKSISYRNGFNDSLQPLGDGNGFKLGKGQGGHTLVQNISWGNKWKGFDHNNAEKPVYLYNNTAHANSVDYNFEKTVTGLSVAHELKNNIGFGSGSKMNANVIQVNNSWNFAWESNPQFLSTDNKSSDYLALSATSPALNAGVNLNLAGFANPPDVGALQEGQRISSLLTQAAATPTPTTAGLSVSQLVLVNSDTNQDILVLTDGVNLNLSTLPTRNLNIRAYVSGVVESVLFKLDSNNNFRMENTPPYVLTGDNSGDYNDWTPQVGQHSVGATPYSGNDGTGIVGAQHLVGFTVSDSQQFASSDLDMDGDVDESDYQLVLSNMGLTGIPGFIPSDIDKDGDVDIYDFSVLVSEFGN
jgi:hypothetical protein